MKNKILILYIILVIAVALWKLKDGILILFGIWMRTDMIIKELVY